VLHLAATWPHGWLHLGALWRAGMRMDALLLSMECTEGAWNACHDSVFNPFATFDQFSSILYDFCMISTIPNNSTQKHKYGENTQLYTK